MAKGIWVTKVGDREEKNQAYRSTWALSKSYDRSHVSGSLQTIYLAH